MSKLVFLLAFVWVTAAIPRLSSDLSGNMLVDADSGKVLLKVTNSEREKDWFFFAFFFCSFAFFFFLLFSLRHGFNSRLPRRRFFLTFF